LFPLIDRFLFLVFSVISFSFPFFPIKTGLLELKKTNFPVRIFTDSSYAYGMLILGWKPKKNLKLIKSIKDIMLKFNNLKLIKVKGHGNIEGNERADFLATSAIKGMK